MLFGQGQCAGKRQLVADLSKCLESEVIGIRASAQSASLPPVRA